MPTWQLIIDPRAEEEARAAFLWYLDRSSRAAEGFQVALEEALTSVAEAPHRWPEVEPRIRKRVLRRYP
jgi:plasmid stabilization system protein ParE